MLTHDCEGCNFFIVGEGPHCGLGANVFFEDKPCPCSICLVKMMCENECEEFYKFRWAITEEGHNGR
jgi:hypothetical protein